ncbi:MAG: winged helix-turn-helix transcriptional regulator [Candidatus Hodarchaeales archaeon]|jgi:DNA-binding HxlR family transcriptional regulator
MIETESEECAASLAMKILGRKWTLYIICELLMCQELFFSQLQEQILGNYNERISARVLSESLSRLEANGVVNRTVHSESMPIRVGYSLTEKGEDFAVIFSALKGWGVKWGGLEIKKCKSYACVHNAVPIIDIDDAKELYQIRECD